MKHHFFLRSRPFQKTSKKTAIELFAQGKATLGEASRIAGISAGEMMELLACRGLHLCPFTWRRRDVSRLSLRSRHDIDSGITDDDLKGLKAAEKVLR